MAKKSKSGKLKERQERRFVPQPTANLMLVNTLAGLAAASLGAGVWAQFGHAWMDSPLPPYGFAPALIAGGAVAFAAAVWLGTSGEPALRVGSGGIAIEHGNDVNRILWDGVERIVWQEGRHALAVVGKDELGRDQRLSISVAVQPKAVAWIVKEARERIPALVDVPDEALGLPAAQHADGEILTMDPVRVVGRRCAASDRVIAYEPDARVCPRCERVYYKDAVPDECACGASLVGLRAQGETGL